MNTSDKNTGSQRNKTTSLKKNPATSTDQNSSILREESQVQKRESPKENLNKQASLSKQLLSNANEREEKQIESKSNIQGIKVKKSTSKTLSPTLKEEVFENVNNPSVTKKSATSKKLRSTSNINEPSRSTSNIQEPSRSTSNINEPSRSTNIISRGQPLLMKAEEIEEEEQISQTKKSNPPVIKSTSSAMLSKNQPSMKKSSESSTHSKVTSRRMSSKNKNTPAELDVELNKLGISPIYTLYVDKDEIEETSYGSTIIAMTPLGTIIGIRLNIGELIPQEKNMYINVKQVQGLAQLEQSWLTALSQKTDVSTIVICKEGACLMTRNEYGKIESSYFEIDTRQLSGEISTPESPTAYPLINLKEITSILNEKDEDIAYENYIAFLEKLKQESDNINTKQVDQRFETLNNNIEFMKSLITNIEFLRDSISDFNTANTIESESLSEKAKELLKLKMHQTSLNENDIKAWRKNQEALSSLAYNEISLINGMKNFNKFREYLESLDRDTFHLFYCLYSRVLTTMENPSNLDIRMPSRWSLADVLVKTTEVLASDNPTIEKTRAALSEDLSKYSPSNYDESTNVLVSHFRNTYYC